MLIFEKLLFFLLMFAIFVVINSILLVAKAYVNNKELNMKLSQKITLGCALSYIFTIIFTGFQLF